MAKEAYAKVLWQGSAQYIRETENALMAIM